MLLLLDNAWHKRVHKGEHKGFGKEEVVQIIGWLSSTLLPDSNLEVGSAHQPQQPGAALSSVPTAVTAGTS